MFPKFLGSHLLPTMKAYSLKPVKGHLWALLFWLICLWISPYLPIAGGGPMLMTFTILMLLVAGPIIIINPRWLSLVLPLIAGCLGLFAYRELAPNEYLFSLSKTIIWYMFAAGLAGMGVTTFRGGKH